jgi:pyrimidine-specific ribonucleoside hydrolase
VPQPGYAAVAIVEHVLAHPGEITLVAVGPLTNVAAALSLDRRLAGSVREIVVMGGVFLGPTHATGMPGEFNIWSDPEAAAAVFGSTVPTVMVGLDVTLPTVLTEEGIARFAAAGPVGATAAAILQQYLDHARGAYGVPGVVVHDALALTEAIAPGTLTTVRRDVVVDTTLGAGRGQTLVDRRSVSDSPTAVEVAEDVDSGSALEFLVSRLSRLDGPA